MESGRTLTARLVDLRRADGLETELRRRYGLGEFNRWIADSRPAGDRAANRAANATPRQAEILELIGEGLSSKEIGLRLSISQRTVETHLQHFFKTNKVRSRSQATRLWERQKH